MLFTDFKDYIQQNISAYLTSDYADAEFNLQHIAKSNGYEYDALTISKHGEKCAIIPALDLTRAFRDYQNGADLDEIVSKLADIRMNAKLEGFDKESILTFEGVRERIMPRLVNTANNAKYLEGKPHIEIDSDISMMFVVRVEETAEGMADAVIDDRLLDLWGVDTATVKATAIENNRRQTPKFVNIEKALFGGASDFDLDNIDLDAPMQLYILSNRQNTQGATMILNDDLMARIADRIGSYYILPSSIHEVLILPKSAGAEAEELANMVKTVNSETVSEHEKLSDKVYEYNIEEHAVQIAV